MNPGAHMASLHLDIPPIIEAVIDIDCDLPAGLELDALRRQAYPDLRELYPKIRESITYEQTVEHGGMGEPIVANTDTSLTAIQFATDDERTIIQFRRNGFSFNKLRPYTSFDDYFGAMEHAWEIFVRLAQPALIRKIGIRTINRIEVPVDAQGGVDFTQYLDSFAPRIPSGAVRMATVSFYESHLGIDTDSGRLVNIVKTMEAPTDAYIPLILDIDVHNPLERDSLNWVDISNELMALRELKNWVFQQLLTPTCLNLFAVTPSSEVPQP